MQSSVDRQRNRPYKTVYRSSRRGTTHSEGCQGSGRCSKDIDKCCHSRPTEKNYHHHHPYTTSRPDTQSQRQLRKEKCQRLDFCHLGRFKGCSITMTNLLAWLLNSPPMSNGTPNVEKVKTNTGKSIQKQKGVTFCPFIPGQVMGIGTRVSNRVTFCQHTRFRCPPFTSTS